MNRRAAGLAALVIITAMIALLRLLVDRDPYAGLSLAWPDESYAVFRWTSILAGFAIGASLAVSGVLLQALLRNPLASPFILGVSSGAGLGVMTAMAIGAYAGVESLRRGTNAGPALLGALAVLGIVYVLGRRKGLLDPLSLVLVGVVIAAMCGAITMFLQRIVPEGVRSDFILWMMGRVPQGIEFRPLAMALGVMLAGTFIAASLGRAMDAATLGDDEARSIGLAIGPLRGGVFVLAGALAAMSVALAGPIAFVGLISPHAARIVVGPRHTILVPAAALIGASLIIGADAASQAIEFGAGRMPVGVFTALLGGPVFIWLLKHRDIVQT